MGESIISNIDLLEAQIRQIFASVVWTHKIQEKQADIYKDRHSILENVRLVISAVTTSGIIATVFIQGNTLKVITAIVSIVTLFINSYFKSYDLNKLRQQHKNSAVQLLEIREKIICLLCDIKIQRFSEIEIIDKRDKIIGELMKVYKNTVDAGSKAVGYASKDLKERGDNTFSDEEIDSFLPIMLRKTKKEN